MSINDSTTASASSLQTFDDTTARWGRLTMIAGLIISLCGPVYLVFFSGLGVDRALIPVAFLAVAGTFGVLWFVEPVTYFPILGQASMYQAFMIGNISNKLLPAALMGQTTVGAKPGTRRGELAAIMAIGGAVVVHLLSLLIFVGIFGTWLLNIIPSDLIEVLQTFILPTVLGAVLVQAIVSQKQPRTTVIALVIASAVVFVLIPALPQLTFFATVIVVFGTVAAAWFFRSRTAENTQHEDVT
ncbi:hypothetical protein [Nesterenkonia marinintestina]|uniref:hypothetical protein n=1 Tax=Nesterenkonia marinintestina TaxID=2979865 RepID=UPI0021BE28B5|nr:hypothetical protein [Nesterenkonia sp. GX14115]